MLVVFEFHCKVGELISVSLDLVAQLWRKRLVSVLS